MVERVLVNGCVIRGIFTFFWSFYSVFCELGLILVDL